MLTLSAPKKLLKYSYGIEVIGTRIYCAQVARALRLLNRKAPSALKLVKKYVGRIEEYLPSGMAPWQKPPTFYMSKKCAFPSVTWCASCIVHDAHHSKLYLDYFKKYKKQPPRLVYSGTKVELHCIRKQVTVSKQIGASDFELTHLRNQDGKHHYRQRTQDY